MERAASSVEAGISDVLLGRGADEDVAVLEANVTYTHAELRVATKRLVSELLERGVRRGDRVGVLGSNSFFWIASYLAALKVGIAIPLAEKLTPDELAAQVEFVQCVVVLADRRQQRRLAGALGGVDVLTDEVLAESARETWPDARVDPESDAAWMFTSGTTSHPKVVRLTHANLFANTASIVEYLALEPADRMLVILPFHYVFGASLLHTHLAVGGSVALCNSFAFPETALGMVDEHGCTGFAGVPSSFQLLLRASSFARRRLPSLRVMQQAGGRLAPDRLRDVAAAQPQAQLFVMYGATEATARLSFLPPEFLESRAGSIGRGIPGVELRVERADGTAVVPGEQGEIVARGANVSPGYVNAPEATAEKFKDGALHTGDLAEVDSDGFIHIVGRTAEFIKSWGHRISPQQIEETAQQHEDVDGAVALGVPDPDAGEAVVLVVTAVDGRVLDSTALKAFLSKRLARHMVPAVVRVVDEIPLTINGKISRQQLRIDLENIAD